MPKSGMMRTTSVIMVRRRPDKAKAVSVDASDALAEGNILKAYALTGLFALEAFLSVTLTFFMLLRVLGFGICAVRSGDACDSSFLPPWIFWPGIVLTLGFYTYAFVNACMQSCNAIRDGDVSRWWSSFEFIPKEQTRLGEPTYALLEGEGDCTSRLASECLFNLLGLPVGFVFACLASVLAQEAKIPPWVWLLSLLIMYRAKLVQARLAGMTLSELLVVNPFGFLASMPGTMAGFSHGVGLANAFVIDSLIHETFIRSWRMGAAAVLQPLAAVLHLPGFMLMSSLLASFCQISLMYVASAQANTNWGNAVLARNAGFDYCAKLFAADLEQKDRHSMVLYLYVYCSLCGAVLYLWWQTSLVISLMTCTSLDATSLASMFLSTFLALKASIMFVFAIVVEFRRRGQELDQDDEDDEDGGLRRMTSIGF